MTTAPVTAKTVSPRDLIDSFANGTEPTLVDVRSAGEFASAHIGGSYNVPLDVLSQYPEAFARKFTGEMMFICHSGRRAQEALGYLDAVTAGANDVTVLDGGIAAYESAGGVIVRGEGAWAMDRQVRMAAGGLVVLGFAAGKLISPKLGYISAMIGTGLVISALTDSCAMAAGLSKMPWNRRTLNPPLEAAIASIPRATGGIG